MFINVESVFISHVPIIIIIHTQHLHSHIQALDTGEGGHSTEYATKDETKLLNRFANIIVCK